ncbi:sensor domain-containing diguanylate cyclase [Bacillus sp. 2205SS5-2]|uniref:sensor domain-containing diguanylate cyclase n=1 Tax=Bacillus sp. 2205SS5-2 TaxID=3109031 RepID=UPI0030060C4E
MNLVDFQAQINIDDVLWYEFADKIESVDAFFVKSNQSFEEHNGGINALRTRDVPYRSILFKLEDPEIEKIYIRLEASQIPIMQNSNLYSTESLLNRIIHYKFNTGIFYGFMISLAFYNLFLFFILRERAYLFYVLYIFSFIFLQIAMNGLDIEYFGKIFPAVFIVDFLDYAALLTCVCMILFSKAFLQLAVYLPILNKVLSLLMYTTVLTILLFSFIPDQLTNTLGPLLAVIITSILWLAGLRVMLRGHKSARYYLIGWSILLISITIQAFSFLGIFPNHPLIYEVIPQTAAALEALFLSIALADRIKILKEEKQEAQEALNHKLEELVALRTTELDSAMKQLESLSNIDQLTKVYNRRKLDQVIDLEISKRKKDDTNLSIILLDIDYFKKINDEYGHQIGDQVLVKVAEGVGSLLHRDMTFGRWGGEEFLIICPNLSLIQAKSYAEQIRSTIESMNLSIDYHLTCSLGVTFYESGESWGTLMSRTDKALYKAKHLGRNRVEVA